MAFLILLLLVCTQSSHGAARVTLKAKITVNIERRIFSILPISCRDFAEFFNRDIVIAVLMIPG